MGDEAHQHRRHSIVILLKQLTNPGVRPGIALP